MSVDQYARVRANLAALQTATWPADRLAIIIDGHEAGKSFADIAKGVRGASKNACIGQARRIGLPMRDRTGTVLGCASVIRVRQRLAREKAQRADKRDIRKAQREMKAERLAERTRRRAESGPDGRLPAMRGELRQATALPPMSGRMITDLGAHQCRFPVGDPRAADFGFCGRLKRDEGPYCTPHYALTVNTEATAQARRQDRHDRRAV